MSWLNAVQTNTEGETMQLLQKLQRGFNAVRLSFGSPQLGLIFGGLFTMCLLGYGQAQDTRPSAAPHDAALDAQRSSPVPIKRPEQKKTAHDQSDIFDVHNAKPSSPVF